MWMMVHIIVWGLVWGTGLQRADLLQARAALCQAGRHLLPRAGRHVVAGPRTRLRFAPRVRPWRRHAHALATLALATRARAPGAGDTPFRRAFVRAIRPSMTEPLSGGIRKWTTSRPELIARDAVCAARSRLANARRNESVCPESSREEERLVQQLLAQAALHIPTGSMAAALSQQQRAPDVAGLQVLCSRLSSSGAGGPA